MRSLVLAIALLLSPLTGVSADDTPELRWLAPSSVVCPECGPECEVPVYWLDDFVHTDEHPLFTDSCGQVHVHDGSYGWSKYACGAGHRWTANWRAASCVCGWPSNYRLPKCEL